MGSILAATRISATISKVFLIPQRSLLGIFRLRPFLQVPPKRNQDLDAPLTIQSQGSNFQHGRCLSKKLAKLLLGSHIYPKPPRGMGSVLDATRVSAPQSEVFRTSAGTLRAPDIYRVSRQKVEIISYKN